MWGSWLEAKGSWLFLNLDLHVLSTTWRVVKRAYAVCAPSVLAVAQYLARGLHGAALQLEQILDTIVRCMWLTVRSLWQRLLKPIVTCLLGVGWGVVSKIWQNPFLSFAYSFAVVVCAYHVHAGRIVLPDFYSISLVILHALADKASSSRDFIMAGLGDMFHHSPSRRSCLWDAVFFMVRPWAASASGQAWRLTASLADRPLEMFADPAFATVAATVTMACSRVALWIRSANGLTPQETKELAARIGRTSQRVLFIPMLLSALFSSISSQTAVRLLQVVGLPLLLVYILASVLFFCGEIRGWRATSSQLHQLQAERLAGSAGSRTRTSGPLGDAPAKALVKDGAECCICLEPLTTESDAADEAGEVDEQEEEQREVNVTIRAELVNGPRSPWYSGSRDIGVSLEVAECPRDGAIALNESTHLRSNITANGTWKLHLWSARVYSVRLVNPSPRTSTPLLLEAKLQVLSRSTEVAADTCIILDLEGDRSTGALHFPGKRRKDPSNHSELRLQGAPVDPGADHQLREIGVEELNLAHVHQPVPTTLASAPETGPVKVTRCGHFFHESCIKEWMKHQNRCPLCRESLSGPGHFVQALL